MLVLSRKKEEQVVIMLGEQVVRVQVLSIDGQKVRLGFQAPDEVAVHREEVWKRCAEFTQKPPQGPITELPRLACGD